MKDLYISLLRRGTEFIKEPVWEERSIAKTMTIYWNEQKDSLGHMTEDLQTLRELAIKCHEAVPFAQTRANVTSRRRLNKRREKLDLPPLLSPYQQWKLDQA